MGHLYCRANKTKYSLSLSYYIMIKDIVKHRAVVHYKHFLRSLRKVAKLYGVSKSSLQRWATSAGVVPKLSICKRKLTSHIAQIVKSAIADNPFVTMKQLADKLTLETGLRHSRQCASRFTKDLRYSKKKVYKGVNHHHDPNKIRAFCDDYLTASRNNSTVCVDEAGFYLSDFPKRGYSPKGQRLRMSCKRIRSKKLTLLLAIRPEGVVGFKILEHNCCKKDFLEFITDLPLRQNDILVMDNISFHHSREVAVILQKKSCSALYIPPYSPKINAVEHVFSVLKTRFRAQHGQSLECLDLIIQNLGEFTLTFQHVLKKVLVDQESLTPFSGYDS